MALVIRQRGGTLPLKADVRSGNRSASIHYKADNLRARAAMRSLRNSQMPPRIAAASTVRAT